MMCRTVFLCISSSGCPLHFCCTVFTIWCLRTLHHLHNTPECAHLRLLSTIHAHLSIYMLQLPLIVIASPVRNLAQPRYLPFDHSCLLVLPHFVHTCSSPAFCLPQLPSFTVNAHGISNTLFNFSTFCFQCTRNPCRSTCFIHVYSQVCQFVCPKNNVLQWRT